MAQEHHERHLQLRQQETLCLEALLSGLDARESAKTAQLPMLVYLSDLLVRRAREDLDKIRVALDGSVVEPGDAASPVPRG